MRAERVWIICGGCTGFFFICPLEWTPAGSDGIRAIVPRGPSLWIFMDIWCLLTFHHQCCPSHKITAVHLEKIQATVAQSFEKTLVHMHVSSVLLLYFQQCSGSSVSRRPMILVLHFRSTDARYSGCFEVAWLSIPTHEMGLENPEPCRDNGGRGMVVTSYLVKQLDSHQIQKITVIMPPFVQPPVILIIYWKWWARFRCGDISLLSTSVTYVLSVLFRNKTTNGFYSIFISSTVWLQISPMLSNKPHTGRPSCWMWGGKTHAMLVGSNHV